MGGFSLWAPNPMFRSKNGMKNRRAGHHSPPHAAETPVLVRSTGDSRCRQGIKGLLTPPAHPISLFSNPYLNFKGKKCVEEHIFIATKLIGCN